MNAAQGDQLLGMVEIGTDWLTHRGWAVSEEREVVSCDAPLRAVRRSATGKNSSVLEVECSNPGCVFHITMSDEAFRRTLERRHVGSLDDNDGLAWWQK